MVGPLWNHVGVWPLLRGTEREETEPAVVCMVDRARGGLGLAQGGPVAEPRWERDQRTPLLSLPLATGCPGILQMGPLSLQSSHFGIVTKVD